MGLPFRYMGLSLYYINLFCYVDLSLCDVIWHFVMWFIIMLCRFFISLCEFIIMLCQFVISLCGFIFLLCQFFISLCRLIIMLCRYFISLCEFHFVIMLCQCYIMFCDCIIALWQVCFTLYQFVISLCGFVVLLCQCCISLCRFVNVVMWTNPSIISVTATPVGSCICRYQSEKAGTVIRNKNLNVNSTRHDPTLPYFTKHSNSTQHVNTRPDPTPPNLPTLPCLTIPHRTP